jgi:hypothetical protein
MFSFISVIIFIAILLLLFLLIGSILPNAIFIKEEIEIEKAPEKVFLQFADLRLFINWCPWLCKIKKSQVIIEGEPLTVSDKVSFRRKLNGYQNSIELMHMEMNKKIIFEFDFGFRNKGKMEIELIQNELSKTTITWNFSLYLSNNPIERLYAFFARTMYNKKLKTGLEKLKEKLETS